jgi:hypothetical protein
LNSIHAVYIIYIYKWSINYLNYFLFDYHYYTYSKVYSCYLYTVLLTTAAVRRGSSPAAIVMLYYDIYTLLDIVVPAYMHKNTYTYICTLEFDRVNDYIFHNDYPPKRIYTSPKRICICISLLIFFFLLLIVLYYVGIPCTRVRPL